MTQGAEISDYADDLDGTLAVLWDLLRQGATDRRSPFHVIQAATIGLDGAPRVRSVVLRHVSDDPAAGLLRFHCDQRSPKMAELAANPGIALHVYSPEHKVQIRVEGSAIVDRDGAGAAQAWADTGRHGRVCYRADFGPSADLSRPDQAAPSAKQLDPDDYEAGWENFAAITVTAARLDWLYLASSGHRRAGFTRRTDGWAGRWMAP